MTTSRSLRSSLGAVALGTALVLLLARATAASDAHAPGGSLDAIGPDGTPRGACPLERTDVHVEVSGFVARAVVTQVFRSPFPDPIEALYTFPLSERAAVDAMTMRVGDRTIRAEIKRREEARALYEAARAGGRVASLLDQERPNVFTQSVANLMPGAVVEVRIEYVEPLAYADGAFALVVPTVVGPRFVPGAPVGRTGTGFAPDTDRVPDASRVTPPVTPPGTRAGHDLGIVVDLDAGVPIGELTAPLHAIDVERPAPDRARVRLRAAREIPNRDFVLRWAVAAEEVRSGWLAHRTGEGDGHLTLLLVPPRRVTAETAAPKELVFVVDRSGSQSGLPLEKAKETLRFILAHMHPHDTFQIVDFGNTANVLFPSPAPASPEMKRRALAHIDALEANGGTMMAEAVRAVCALPADANRLRIVTFMTDGYVGNDFEVLDLVRSLRGRSRWFAFGTGNSVNRFLLDGIARAGGGEVDYVLLEQPGEEVARRFWQRIASPVLTDVRLDFEGLDVTDAYPTAPGDVWAERPLVVHARYRTPGTGRVVLRGFRQGRPYRQELAVTLPAAAPGHAAVASMWARARVEELMWQAPGGLQSGTFPAPLREEIVQTALAYRLLTQFTSFVAVEERVVNEGGTSRRVVVPVDMPDGVRYEGVFGVSGPAGRAQHAPTELLAQESLAAPRALADRAAAPSTPVAPAAEEKHPSVPAAARARLAPELLALLEGGPAAPRPVPVVDGRVTIRVRLGDDRPRTVRRLGRLGLRVHQRAPGWLVGSVPLADLGRLAAQDGVERVELP